MTGAVRFLEGQMKNHAAGKLCDKDNHHLFKRRIPRGSKDEESTEKRIALWVSRGNEIRC